MNRTLTGLLVNAMQHMPVVDAGRKIGDMAKSEPLPDGIYHVRIDKTEEKRSEPSQANPDPWPYIATEYTVCGGSPEEFHGRKFFENMTVAPGKDFTLRQLSEAIGLGEDDEIYVVEGEGQPAVFQHHLFFEKELLVAVTTEKAGKGKDGKHYEARNKVTRRMPLQS